MERVAAIDIFRAVTMLLMIFVNDLWTIRGTPHWLEHFGVYEDGMGFSDVVFPWFLFIVGLSIPFSIKAHKNASKTKIQILKHVFKRTFSLLVMGFFFVNHEYYREDVGFFVRNTREVAMVIAFFLIWNSYKKNRVWKKIPVVFLKITGIYILLILAATYHGGTLENPQWMNPHWWGILGLIGWAYFFCSLVYLLIGNRIWIFAVFLIILHVLNVQEFRPVFGIYRFRVIVSASNYALVTSGIVAALIYLKLKDTRRKYLVPLLLLLPGVVFIAYGFTVRPLWGISKILATPSWTAICAGTSFMCFALIYVVSDIFHFTGWAKPVLPAGRSALTCYLLPGMIYALFYPYLARLPEYLTGGAGGIFKSFVFALAIVLIAGGLEKIKISIKL